jgi:hypothetical protein
MADGKDDIEPGSNPTIQEQKRAHDEARRFNDRQAGKETTAQQSGKGADYSASTPVSLMGPSSQDPATIGKVSDKVDFPSQLRRLPYKPATPEQVAAVAAYLAKIDAYFAKMEAIRQRENSPEFKAKRAEIDAAAAYRASGRKSSGKIDIIESLIDPIPYRVRQRLIAEDQLRVDIWSPTKENGRYYVETVLDAMKTYAVCMCFKLGLPDGADEMRQRAVEKIWDAAQRDGRKVIYDRRRSQSRPQFRDWIQYIRWALSFVKFETKSERRAKTIDAKIFRTPRLKGPDDYEEPEAE